ncbi:antibiotic biosynthesis monooxygenase [uncultured Chitinophaga sp.]|uniref:putative quinol monooxygenase n=1 Tax=uncultured Chitinophaga sp. TaxID=339340 RepID=UPI00261A5A48|nr:antibiotic biosynthesis monooxygenase [uncultured Chitinophaga sp.]
MYQRENPNQVRIVEIYASKAAHQAHLATPHFQHYQTSTRHMVKSPFFPLLPANNRL